MLFVRCGDFCIAKKGACNVEDGVYWKTAAARGSVNHSFAAFGVEHFNAHVNHMPRREVLSLFTFSGFANEILKRLIYNL